MPDIIEHQACVPLSLARQRLDWVAARLFPQYSRARLQQWIEAGELTVDGMHHPAKHKVVVGATLHILAAPKVLIDAPEAISLNILHEDEAIMVINKPAGLVVHPGAGNRYGTLLNALLHHAPQLSSIPRAGIVHRLDKDTTGLIVIAKQLGSQNYLLQQLSKRQVSRRYEAIVYGRVTRPGRVDAPIARDPRHRTRMAVRISGKTAVTHYEALRSFPHYSHVKLSLETGRTHQIRVHMQRLGFPLVGDAVYGGRFRQPVKAAAALTAILMNFNRQALHASQLAFTHPISHQPVSFTAPIPVDLAGLITAIDQFDVD